MKCGISFLFVVFFEMLGSSPRCLMSECKEVPENGTSFFSNIKGYNIENSYKKLSIFYIACKKIVYYVRI